MAEQSTHGSSPEVYGSSGGTGSNSLDAGAVVADEYTPLLAAPSDTTAQATRSDSDISGATLINNKNGNGNIDDDGDNRKKTGTGKPFPVRQLLLLCYTRLVEPIAFFSIFPYINKMVQETGGLDKADVGFYSGLIESLFSLTQMAVMLPWGRAADRFGRKPVLVASLVGVAATTALFGMARTTAQMILFRCLAGVFAGTVVTVRTMISEHTTVDTQARAFSWFAFTGNMGILLGPLLGGVLVDPAEQYPALFGGIQFFHDYPYALPSFATGAVGLSAAIVCALFVEETLPSELKKGSKSNNNKSNISNPDITDDEEASTGLLAADSNNDTHPTATADNANAIKNTHGDLSVPQLVRQPGVGLVLYAYGHVMLLAFAYTAIVPVFWYTPVALGGYAFTPLQISLLMALNGLSQAIWVLLVFPPLHRRAGTNGVIRLCGSAYPFFFLLIPFSSMLLRWGTPGAVATFWVITPTLLAIGCGVSMAFTAVQLALNDVSPGPRVLGTLNALALAVSSGVRSFTPALFSGLFAVGARTQWLGGYAIWLLMALLAAGFALVARYMPDYDELRRRRERGGEQVEEDAE